jgi:hypothetical protein
MEREHAVALGSTKERNHRMEDEDTALETLTKTRSAVWNATCRDIAKRMAVEMSLVFLELWVTRPGDTLSGDASAVLNSAKANKEETEEIIAGAACVLAKAVTKKIDEQFGLC